SFCVQHGVNFTDRNELIRFGATFTHDPGVGDMRKKLLLLSSALLTAALSSASAADLPMHTKAPPLPPPPVFSWTGFYIGANIGGKWANVGHEVTGAGTTFTFNNDTASSFIGGGQ